MLPRSLAGTGALLALLIAGNLSAQAASRPTCDGPEYRQFDFWIGDWNVVNNGKQAGTNLVTREEDGCLLHEHWHSPQSTGQSLNFYNRDDGKWHQLWVSNSGNVLDLVGQYADGKMAFTGRSKQPNGQPLLHRLTFYHNADGTVRQEWLTSADDGKTWQGGWDATYTLKKDQP